jgi:Heterokaryon incompatibility protein (HET)
MMRDIYRGGKIVTVFLGSGTVGGYFLIGKINRIGGFAMTAGIQTLGGEELMDLLNDKTDNSSSKVKRAVLELADQVGRDFPWEAYNDLTKYDYWKRVWVFQEFFYNSSVPDPVRPRRDYFRNICRSPWFAEYNARRNGILQNYILLQRDTIYLTERSRCRNYHIE